MNGLVPAEGAKVVVADLNAERGEQVAKQILADGGTAVYHRVDVADPNPPRSWPNSRLRSSARSTTSSTTPPATAT